MNHQLVNKLAEEVQNTPYPELKDIYENKLFEELQSWIKNTARKYHNSMKAYGGDYSHIVGCVEDGVLRWVRNNDAHEEYDAGKGHFVGFIQGHVRNELKKYKSKLMVKSRNIESEGMSLNDSPSTDSENTYGELISDDATYSVGEEVADKLHVANLLDEFAASTKEGQAKADAIYKSMYPEFYDTQDVAEALGYETYNANARKKFERVRKEFQKFMSQQN
ncbi:hypothetical protein MOC17_20455 [Bacillus haynesii]|uniref:hypothetical protein n=1 Tax=Bacillus haynesii TaxID=1925021 RepID=UPI00227E09BD|nr:hypothetical protein [Bacillus haynesii]MCY8048429.1 hypothetical protein [Bacillus haynesii]